MKNEQRKAYLDTMLEIKRRDDVIRAFLKGEVRALYERTQIESVALQVRMVLELIALGSLAANEELYEENRQRFLKKWHPKDIMRELARLNPQFYPEPVLSQPSDREDAKSDLLAITDGYMTPDELTEVHGRCGDVLHARHPSRSVEHFGEFMKAVPQWMTRIHMLLNSHLIKLVDEERMYLVHMESANKGLPTMYTFRRVGPD